MISTNDFKTGMTIDYEGNLFQVIEFQHVKPGKRSYVLNYVTYVLELLLIIHSMQVKKLNVLTLKNQQCNSYTQWVKNMYS